jgi:shikimate kinase
MDLQVEPVQTRTAARGFTPCRTVVLVGLMGAGKTKIGRRLATRLNLPFFDSDDEIEEAAGETIAEIFRNRGEAVFREGERRVIARLLCQPVHILATGGGAFMDPATRAVIRSAGISIWLRADLEVLLARVARRSNRPLLSGRDQRAVMEDLIERRHPIYAEADLTVDSGGGAPEATVARVLAALSECPRALLPPDPESGK